MERGVPLKELSLHPIEHAVTRNFREAFPEGKGVQNLDLLVSGGLDSMVLLSVLHRLKGLLKIDLRVLHLHHGEGGKRDFFRDQARDLVFSFCEKERIPFLTHQSSKNLTSEEECRDFRRSWIRQVSPGRVVTTGHHLNDALENDLIRLIRGTGPRGLTSFKIWNGHVFRPLLTASREQIRTYAENRSLVWIEDPSNQDERYLRNFLRNRWLPELESHRKGALSRLQKSLELIKESLLQSENLGSRKVVALSESISLPWYSTLSVAEKKQLLARYMLEVMKVSFTVSQIKEIHKQLDIPKRVHRFTVAGLVWHSNAEQFWAEKKAKIP